MKTLSDYTSLLLLSTTGMLVICSVLVITTENADGVISGMLSWSYFSIACFALSVLYTVLAKNGKTNMRFTTSDGLGLLMTGMILLSYAWGDNPAPDKLYFMIMLLILWFLLRITFSLYSFLSVFFLFIFLYTAIAESVWGIGQIGRSHAAAEYTGLATGSFCGTIPLAGYLAMMFPLCLHVLLHSRECDLKHWWNMRTILFFVSLAACLLILILLPATRHMGACLAAIVSGVWVLVMHGMRRRTGTSGRVYWVVAVSSLLLAVGTGTLICLLDASASGGQVMPLQVSWIGHGLGGEFSAVANDYQQLMGEHGLAGVVLFLLLVGSCIYAGLANRRYGIVGGLLSLTIFSFTYNPSQIPSFLIIMVFFMTMSLTRPYASFGERRAILLSRMQPQKDPMPHAYRRAGAISFTVVAGCMAATLFLFHSNLCPRHTEWNRRLLGYGARRTADYPGRLSYYTPFLCEYAVYLSHSGLYDESIRLLNRAAGIYRTPVVYTMLAKNYEALGEYDKAERYLIYSIRMLPDRVYPYYLLARLYAHPSFYHPDKMKVMARKVLEKKVDSFRLREENDIEDEMKHLLY